MKFNSLVPELEVSDLRQSLKFYVDVLGFKVEFDRPASNFAYLSFHGSQLMICEMKKQGEWQTGNMEHPFGRGMHLQIEVPAIGPMLERLEGQKRTRKASLNPKGWRYSQDLNGAGKSSTICGT